jgi:hypothetical protein
MRHRIEMGQKIERCYKKKWKKNLKRIIVALFLKYRFLWSAQKMFTRQPINYVGSVHEEASTFFCGF